MALLVTVVLGDVVEVFTADDDGTVHLGGDDTAGQNTATDGDLTDEGALLVCLESAILSSMQWVMTGDQDKSGHLKVEDESPCSSLGSRNLTRPPKKRDGRTPVFFLFFFDNLLSLSQSVVYPNLITHLPHDIFISRLPRMCPVLLQIRRFDVPVKIQRRSCIPM